MRLFVKLIWMAIFLPPKTGLFSHFGGGLLTVLPNLCEKVLAHQLIATQRNIFGDVIREYHAPEAGIVIGKSTNPVGQTGARILHFGIIAKERL